MDMNHPINNHYNTSTTTTSNWLGESFSMSMETPHNHHHQQNINNPIIPLFDHQVWPNYLHNNTYNNNNKTGSGSFTNLTENNKRQKDLEEEGDEDEEEDEEEEEEEEEELGAMKEMMYRYAVMQPVDIDPSTIRKPKRRNVRISNDPQTVAARHRRERISEKIRILQRLVPGGIKLDTASMLDEAIRYVKFLKKLIKQLEKPSASSLANQHPPRGQLLGWVGSGLGGPSSLEGSIGQRDGNNKVVLMRDHFHNHHHRGMFFQHEGN